MNHSSKQAARTGRSRLALQISLAFGASAVMFGSSALAATSSDSATTNTFRDQFINNVVKGTRVHGRAGVYDFRRWHDANKDVDDKRSTAYGGYLDLHTGMVYGFSAGGEFVYTDNFYDPDSGNWNGNPNLGPASGGSSLTTFSALYGQYNAPGFQARVGRQLVTTPFASNDRFSFNPRSFDGASVIIAPFKWMGKNQSSLTSNSDQSGQRATAPSLDMNAFMPLSASDANGQSWKIYGAKFSRTKYRGQGDEFSVNNNFYGIDTPGLWSIGTSYRKNTPEGNYIFQAYHHTFQAIQNLEYVEAGYIAPAKGETNFAPYVRAQYVRADDTDNANAKIQDYGGIKSDIFGLKVGFKSEYVNGSLQANYSPEHNGTLGDGQMLHPYSDLSGFLYTDTMNNGMQEIGPGYAVGGSLALKPGYGFGVSVAGDYYHAKEGNGHRFYTLNSGGDASCASGPQDVGSECGSEDSYGINVGLSYNFGELDPALSGLHVSNTLGITHFDSNVEKSTFYDNRLRFYYTF
ncbi:hypothetical protein [Salinisphaera orenii]|uniref:hypothetical protein n=1 Tax=Salinisphaera orenii TaxID=856731 RepID=UPI0013A6508C